VRTAVLLFVLVALAFMGNTALGVYHAGVEWQFWPGPAACTGSQQLTTNAGNLLDALQQTNVVRCDQAAWRMFGLSMAGWNAIASLLIAFLALRAANEASHPR
jgi:disulfide bond formation protein DsbB